MHFFFASTAKLLLAVFSKTLCIIGQSCAKLLSKMTYVKYTYHSPATQLLNQFYTSYFLRDDSGRDRHN